MNHQYRPTVLSVQNLSVGLVTTAKDVISEISFDLKEGEVLGLVGESGSGKTTLSSALLGYSRHGAKITQGKVELDGEDILALDEHALRQIRGSKISHVAQDPGTALNPSLRIGQHLDELLEVHHKQITPAERLIKVKKILQEVGLPADDQFLKRFPHQLSGGQQQRILLALAFLLHPRLIVLDEPTTALDVTTQTLVLNIIRKLCQEYKVSAIYVSHDLTVVKDIADRVIVLYSGRIAEDAQLPQLFEQPKHPYTQGLIHAIPDVSIRKLLSPIEGHAPSPNHRPAGCAFAPRCFYATDLCRTQHPQLIKMVDEFEPHFVACHHLNQIELFEPVQEELSLNLQESEQKVLLNVENINAWYGHHQVLFDASFQLRQGECLALVGESGSGKTTLSRALAGLNDSVEGKLFLEHALLPFNGKLRTLAQRHQLQYIFQNPYKALNPAHTIGQTLSKVVEHFYNTTKAETAEKVAQVLAKVSLPLQVKDLYPRDLSGGERQRIAIARALLCQPKILICDEITSALDVSVQASILKLLQELQKQGVTLLFVTHNLGVVRAIADRIAVLKNGKIVEYGHTDQVLNQPKHAYTQLLLAHAPSLYNSTAAKVEETQHYLDISGA